MTNPTKNTGIQTMPEGKSDDLMEAAIRAVDAAREDLLLAKASDNKDLLRQVAISVVHGALLAERETTEAKMLALLKDPAAVRINYLRGDIACQALIDEAVLAEREACAKIASAISTDLRNGGQTRFAAALIANSIRSGDRTSSTEES
ncbi:hypothetical protein ABCW43_00240 [Neorhizobium sp. IRAMC:178]|uniref:hypothetical protein n=1 Tax=Neorhizobium tunisiense TaxID=3144793 RepID=UPI0031F70988